MDDSEPNLSAASMGNPARKRNVIRGHCYRAALVATIANLGAVGVMLTLVFTPADTAIRPMNHTAIAVMFAVLGLFVAAPLSIAAIWNSCGSKRVVGTSLLLFSLAPLPLSSLALHAIAGLCGFTLKP